MKVYGQLVKVTAFQCFPSVELADLSHLIWASLNRVHSGQSGRPTNFDSPRCISSEPHRRNTSDMIVVDPLDRLLGLSLRPSHCEVGHFGLEVSTQVKN